MKKSNTANNNTSDTKTEKNETTHLLMPKEPCPTTVISISDNSDNNKDSSRAENAKCNRKQECSSSDSFWTKYLGLFLTLISAMLFSLNALIVKCLNKYHPLNLGVWIFPLSCLLNVPFILHRSRYKKLPVLDSVWPIRRNYRTIIFIFIRSLSSVSALLFLYYSMQYLSLADALVIASSSTIFVYFLGWAFLGEKCGYIPLVTAILAITGVAVITRPPALTGHKEFDMNLLIGAGLGFGCMLLLTVAIVAVRFLQNVYHGVLNIVLYAWGEMQTVTLAFAMGVLEMPTDPYDIVLMVTSGVVGLLAQSFLAVALQREQAGPVALVRTCEVIFAFVWQFVFLGVAPDVLSLLGATLIVTGVIITVLRKWVESLPDNNSNRRRFSIILN